eukprot:3503761-Amphidinium_carterae.2
MQGHCPSSSSRSSMRSEHHSRVQRLIDARVLGRLSTSVAELHKVMTLLQQLQRDSRSPLGNPQ